MGFGGGKEEDGEDGEPRKTQVNLDGAQQVLNT